MKKFSDFYSELLSEEQLSEKAPPDPEIEKWASDPKVKAHFKSEYGARWKEVMYASAWKKYKEKGKK